MTEPHGATGPDGVVEWLFHPAGAFDRLFQVAQELRHADDECLEAFVGAPTTGPDSLPLEERKNVRRLVEMMRGLDLHPEAIRGLYPTITQRLERACSSCTEEGRCDRELANGTAPATYAQFCPNASRLNALVSVGAATAKP